MSDPPPSADRHDRSIPTGADGTHQTLRARAAVLAKVLVEGAAALAEGARIEVVEFRLGPERYGIESASVREVYPLRDLTPLPGTPPFVRGIVNVRGRVLCVIDLRSFFDLPFSGLTNLNKVIILESERLSVGILADAVVGIRQLDPASLQPALPTLTGIRARYLRGVAPDCLAVIDAARLLGSDEILVNQELEANA